MKEKVNIKYACNKEWHSLTPLDDKTKHCSNCDSKINDFTSDKLINQSAIHCGHFNLGQISSVQRQFTMNTFSALTFSLLSILGASASPKQSLGKTKTQQTTTKTTKHEHGNIKLSGQVKDKETNEPISLVSIVVKLDDIILTKTTTDIGGNFSLTIDTTFATFDKVEILFSYVGYKEDTLSTLSIPKELLNKKVTINLVAKLNIAPIELTKINAKPIELTNFNIMGQLYIEPSQSISLRGKESKQGIKKKN